MATAVAAAAVSVPMTAAFMALPVTAAVVTTLMAFLMMATDRIRIIRQPSCKEIIHCGVRISRRPRIQPDSGPVQRHPRSAAYTAANQYIHLISLQKTGQSAMSASRRIQHLCTRHASIRHLIELKATAMSEMLKDLSVFIRNRYSHPVTIPFC